MESTGGRACDDDPAGGFLVPWLDTLTGEARVGAPVTSIPNKSDPRHQDLRCVEGCSILYRRVFRAAL